MNLIIDIGNTLTKFSVFNRDEILITVPVDEFTQQNIYLLKKEYEGLDNAIVSATKNYSDELKNALQQNFKQFIDVLGYVAVSY